MPQISLNAVLSTDRLVLGPFYPGDEKEMFANWAHNPNVTRFLTWNPHKTLEDTRFYLDYLLKKQENPHNIVFALRKKENGELIGSIDVVKFMEEDGCPVVGYVLSAKEWNKGYMSEAFSCLCNYLFSLGYARIHISAAKENVGSNKVIQKNGFSFVKETYEPISKMKPDVYIHRVDYVKGNPTKN